MNGQLIPNTNIIIGDGLALRKVEQIVLNGSYLPTIHNMDYYVIEVNTNQFDINSYSENTVEVQYTYSNCKSETKAFEEKINELQTKIDFAYNFINQFQNVIENNPTLKEQFEHFKNMVVLLQDENK